ncbi:hypothetical protein M432DRAFT_629883 [Thermoascus aurantiacus ATCC 26904]
MAEQSSHDVVNQTRSGGDASPSDVPASKPDNKPAGGDAGENKDNAQGEHAENQTSAREQDAKTEPSNALADNGEVGKASGSSAPDNGKSGPGPVASRALELNGVSSTSDGGEDTGSQGGSESDTSRTDGRQNTRAASAKKPTTFKPVTFAKFSVPKAPGAAAPPKAGDKASASATTLSSTPPQSSRPRLVAKSTSGLRDSASKATLTGVKSGGTAPDPSQVWNKNRPAQPPPTKHLTDEELKQQYGIHMTSRIQEDGGSTEAKWADIDDDEDDWAPETIEWNDGTKITLTHSESTPAPSQDTKAFKDVKEVPPSTEPSTAQEASKTLSSKSSTSVGPNATVLRVGANAERQQTKTTSVSSKGQNERPTLTAKSPAPPPAKSPWAPLPPVDKVSPVNPPVQTQPQSRFFQRDSHAQDGINGPSPAKEIAADDFNRSWRDSPSNGPRELYNSHSGRYEPVSDTRKGLPRNEQNLRPPSLLQRPSHNEQSRPAEPSPAFQTHRSSAQDGSHWTRRRTSSNVSGESGSFGRRMSLGRSDGPSKPSDARGGSQVNGAIERSVSPRNVPPRAVSPGKHAAGTAWQSRTSTNMTYAPPGSHAGVSQTTPSSTSGEPAGTSQVIGEDLIAMQQRIMKEKTIEARQRRMEQEQREEAERRERIRLKLEALGPPPEKKPKNQDKGQEKSQEKSQEKGQEKSQEKGQEKGQEKSQEPSVASKPAAKESAPPTTAPASQSPPKPPVVEPTGEPKQYGMMKVHPPESVKKPVAANERVPEKSASATHGQRVPSPKPEPKDDAAKANGLRQPGESSQPQPSEQRTETAVDEKGPQWRTNLNVSSSYSPWASGSKLGSHPSSSANPWKPLSSERVLGNGTFDRNLPGFPTRDLPLRGPLGLSDQAPIGPPSTSSSQPFSGSSRIVQDNTSISPLPSPEVRNPTYDSLNPIARPGPIGPPSSQSSHWQHDSRRSSETAAWNNFHAVAAKKEAEENEKFHRELSAMRDDGTPSVQISFHETWRQVRTGDQAGQRQVVGVTRTNDAGGSLSTLNAFDHAIGGLTFSESHSRPFSNVTGRGSRFFPHMAEQTKSAVSEDDGYLRRSPSPPPPEEMSSHPVFGDSQRPLVHLPTPKPVVKLPPKPASPPPQPVTFASMVAATPLRPQPTASTSTWQDRFDGLFGKKVSTEKKQEGRTALAVTSATKEPLDVQSHPAPAAVSLPQSVESDSQRDAGKVTSKEVEEEEEIFEDREAGSLPVVRVPNMAPPAAWHAALPPTRARTKYLKAMQVHSIEPYRFGIHDKDGSIHVSIRFPGSDTTKTVTLPKKAGGHGPRQRGGSSYFKSRKNAKSREGSGSFNSKKPNPSNSTNGSTASSRAPFGNASWGPRAFA